jgi:hypothetical protein
MKWCCFQVQQLLSMVMTKVRLDNPYHILLLSHLAQE